MADPVQAATTYIHQKLDSSGVFNTVTHAEMNDIAAKLQSLSPADADAVIDNLAKSGDLKTLAAEGMDGSWFGNGGYSASERKAFFSDMAKKLDGDSLAKLTNAFVETDKNGLSGLDRGKEMGDAIATHGSTQQKTDFVRAMGPKTTDQKSVNSIGIVSTSIDADPQAAAVANVIGSMRGPAAEGAFKALNPAQQRAVMMASIETDMTTTASMGGGGSTPVVSWNTKSFDSLMTAAASTGDADLKARLFDAGTDTMRSVRQTNSQFGGLVVVGRDNALSTMADGLTRVINSDTSGVISELNLNSETRDGSDMAAYSAQMLASGKEGDLGKIMAKLQFGNKLNENAVARLYSERPVSGTGGDVLRPNAEALGYFIGSVSKGAEFVTKDIAQQREMTTAVLKSALTLVDKAAGFIPNKAIGAPIAISASVAKEWVQMGVRAAIDDPTAGAAARLEASALPTNPVTHEPAIGSKATNDFGGAAERVIRRAIP